MDGQLLLGFVRALIPRWNFFDEVGHHFDLEFRVIATAPWERISFDQRRRWGGLFFNPDANLALLQVGLLEQFAADVQKLVDEEGKVDSAAVNRLTTFQLVCDLLRTKLKSHDIPGSSLQFKLVAGRAEEDFDIYVSDWLSLERA